MDELEISGRRYLSSKRAAKEHKYHADYIGQLIRAGKVVGTKVGRAWYVEAESLAEYLASESGSATAQASATYAPAPVQIKKEEPRAATIQSYSVPIKKTEWEEESVSVPPVLKTNTLRYIADDEPLFPAIQKTTYVPTPQPQFQPQQSTQRIAQRMVPERRTNALRPVVALLLVFVVGGLVFGSVFLASTKLQAVVAVEQGQPAIVGFSFK